MEQYWTNDTQAMRRIFTRKCRAYDTLLVSPKDGKLTGRLAVAALSNFKPFTYEVKDPFIMMENPSPRVFDAWYKDNGDYDQMVFTNVVGVPVVYNHDGTEQHLRVISGKDNKWKAAYSFLNGLERQDDPGPCKANTFR